MDKYEIKPPIRRFSILKWKYQWIVWECREAPNLKWYWAKNCFDTKIKAWDYYRACGGQ